MIEKLDAIGHLVGNTPMKRLNIYDLEVYAKLEYNNFTGSVKDRAAFNVLKEGIKKGEINQDTQIVESSSGNFAIALATMCKALGLKFTAVIDPNINALYEKYINLLAYNVVKVDEIDATGGYLLTRIETVKEICAKEKNSFWTNQYENPNNYLAYYHGLGNEICSTFPSLDYLFVAVSSCGTITGLSQKLKEFYPSIKIIAVDVEGSVVFDNSPKKRNVTGLGASKRPVTIEKAKIDSYILVSEQNIIKASKDLINEQQIFGGASTGASYHAIKQYFKDTKTLDAKVLFLCHDKGYAYMNTVYDDAWAKSIANNDMVGTIDY